MSNNQNNSGTRLNTKVFVIMGLVLTALIFTLVLVNCKPADKPAASPSASPTEVPTQEPATPEPTIAVQEISTTASGEWTVAKLEQIITDNTPIYFKKDSIKLRDDAEMAKVEAISAALKHYKNIHLFFKGHTAAYNLVAYRYALSQARADRIRWALENRAGEGITSVTVKGYGSSKLLVKGDSEEERAPNRRCEIILQNAEPLE